MLREIDEMTEKTPGDDVRQEVTPTEKQKMLDPRGPRFGAAITTVVLAAALLALPSQASDSMMLATKLASGPWMRLCLFHGCNVASMAL